MNLNDLFIHYAPAYKDNWKAVEEYFTHDVLEYQHIQTLMKEIADNGLQEPIRLDKESSTVANGMHRIMAHKWLNKETIPVVYDEENFVDEDFWMLNITFIYAHQEDHEKALDLSALLSFRLTSDLWVEASGAGSFNQRQTQISFLDVPHGLEKLLRDKCVEKLCSFGISNPLRTLIAWELFETNENIELM